MEYIKNHWQGKQTLKQSFWINLITFSILVCTLEYLIHHYSQSNGKQFAIITVGYFLFFHIIFFIWQVVGVLRACDYNLKNYISSGWTRAAQFFVLTGFIATVIWGIDLGQLLLRQKIDLEQKLKASNASPSYELNITNPENLRIKGTLSPGITREVKKLVSQNQQIEQIELDSTGGNIFEARGLAKLIIDRNFSTYVSGNCLSSCTTVFVAGLRRIIDKNAKFGFHQYTVNAKKLLSPNVDIEKELDKDLAFFVNQGVEQGFLDKAFSTPSEQMWFPSYDELEQAGILKP